MPAMRQSADHGNQADAGQQPGDLGRRLGCAQALLQLGNQIRERDIHEAGGGHHQQLGQGIFELGHQPETQQPAQGRHRTGQ